MTDGRPLLALCALLAVTVGLVSWGVLGSSDQGDSIPASHRSVGARCYWAVTINELHGYAGAPCDSHEPPPLKNAKFFCAIDTLSGRPRPAPNNDLANC
jgi:hypothetical protein